MDENTGDEVDQDTQAEDHTTDVEGPYCSIREYRTARQEFFAAVEEYRRASEEYLEALEATYIDCTSAPSGAQKAQRENLEAKRLKREAALLVVVTNLQLA